MDDAAYISSLVDRARAAQAVFERDFDQQAVDAILRDMAKVTFFNAEKLARLAADETRMGNYESKVKKIQGKSRIFWWSLKDRKSMGVISRDEVTGITEIAKPVGVVGAVQPCTNPTVTPLGNSMAALKGKNAIILAPHPRGQKSTETVTALWHGVLDTHRAPRDLVQVIEQVSIERTNLLMQKVDVVVATGGPGMVKSAYSSGKPSFGVGPGNVQVILDRDIDVKDALAKIVAGRIFDNGIICAGEQTIITPEERVPEVIAALKALRCHVVEDEADRKKLVAALFPRKGVLNKDLVGQSVEKVVAAAGLTVDPATVLLVVPADPKDPASDLRREKMFPVIALYPYRTFEDAMTIAEDNLAIEGKGHSVAIHSGSRAHIEALGLRAKVSRVVVNATSATSAGGSFANGLAATSTLGCGSWGNNSISENFTYRHLLNITRIAMPLANARMPSDEELFGPAD
jgi:succinate-semialdehyde dehydrogenase